MQTLTLSPSHPFFVAEVQGIDLREPTDAALAAEIEAAMDEFAVLVFRDQVLDESQQMAFTRALGPSGAAYFTSSHQGEERNGCPAVTTSPIRGVSKSTLCSLAVLTAR